MQFEVNLRWVRAAGFGLAVSIGVTSPAQEKPVRDAISKAEAARAEGKTERAAAELRMIATELSCVADADARKSLTTEVDALFGDLDPLAPRLKKAFAAAAGKLVAVAEQYSGKGWHRSALELLVLARDFDAASTKEAFEDLSKALGDTVATRVNLDFAAGEAIYTKGKWVIEDGVIRSPPMPEHFASYFSGNRVPPEFSYSARVQLPSEGAVGGLLFGISSVEEMYEVVVFRENGQGHGIVSRRHTDGRTKLWESRPEAPFDADGNVAFDVRVEVRGARLRCWIGKEESEPMNLGDPLAPGFVGLTGWSGRKGLVTGPVVEWSNVEVTR